MHQIDDIEQKFELEKYSAVLKGSLALKDKIKKLRQTGLEEAGAYSVENLAFKVLRRSGYLGKLSDLKNASYDELMSMENGSGRIRIKI